MINYSDYPRKIRHEEYTYRRRRVILSTVELRPGRFETMLLYHSGLDIAREQTTTEAAALRVHDLYRRKYPADIEKQPQAAPVLTGKYAKLRDDLRKVAEIGKAAAAATHDGGTCNHDAPALHLPRWRSSLIEAACEQAGCHCFKWDWIGGGVWVFGVNGGVGGQANKREAAAEAMTKAFKDLGYDALTYSAMD